MYVHRIYKGWFALEGCQAIAQRNVNGLQLTQFTCSVAKYIKINKFPTKSIVGWGGAGWAAQHCGLNLICLSNSALFPGNPNQFSGLQQQMFARFRHALQFHHLTKRLIIKFQIRNRCNFNMYTQKTSKHAISWNVTQQYICFVVVHYAQQSVTAGPKQKPNHKAEDKTLSKTECVRRKKKQRENRCMKNTETNQKNT